MDKNERLEKLMDDVMNSIGNEGEGVYDRIEISMDDFMFLMEEAKKG